MACEAALQTSNIHSLIQSLTHSPTQPLTHSDLQYIPRSFIWKRSARAAAPDDEDATDHRVGDESPRSTRDLGMDDSSLSGIKMATSRARMTNMAPNANGGPGIMV